MVLRASIGLVTAGLMASTHAAVYTFSSGFANGGVIPDGNPTGWTDTRSLSGEVAGSTIQNLTVSLNVSGGWNGDLYAYLSYTPSSGSGSGYAVLLNRVGRVSSTSNPFGYGDTGFSITLDDSSGYNDIHAYQNYSPSFNGSGQLTSTWQTDGRNTDPATVSFTDPRTTSLANFRGLNANGTWTLFFADMVTGDQSTLQSWSLNISTIPEPANVALGLFAGSFVLFQFGKRLQNRVSANPWLSQAV
jgi:hypothetical protein